MCDICLRHPCIPGCPGYDDPYEDLEILSLCCGAEIINHDICSQCKEHCNEDDDVLTYIEAMGLDDDPEPDEDDMLGREE